MSDSALAVVIDASNAPAQQVPVQQAPAVDFTALKAQLDLLDTPDAALPGDKGAMQAIRHPAEQAILNQDAAGAQQGIAALQALRARVLQVVAALAVGTAIFDRLDAAWNAVPQPVRTAYGKQSHPVSTVLDPALATLRNHQPTTDFNAIDDVFRRCEPQVAGLEAAVAGAAQEFAQITRLWSQFAAELNGKDKETGLSGLAKRFFSEHPPRPQDWTALVNKAQALVVPSSETMQSLQQQPANAAGQNPGAAMLQRLVNAGMVQVATTKPDFYESSYDLAVDHFGASWGLTPKSGTGKMQWLTSWEFHIHGEAVRNPAQVPTGFHILVGHIKPSKSAHALGISIEMTGPILQAVEVASAAQFVRWATSKDGEQTLSRKKRSG